MSTGALLGKAVIVIPTYNEYGNLLNLINAIRDQKVGVDILVVDDNSPDGTGELADKLALTIPEVNVLHRTIKNGLGRAYIEGFNWALKNDYEVILMMDADLSHDPAALPLFMKEIETHDAVFGSRYIGGVRVENWPFKRLLISWLSNEFVRQVLRVPCTDATTAYKCFRRSVLEAINLDALTGTRNDFMIEISVRPIFMDFRTKEIPFMFRDRVAGKSKMEFGVAGASLFMVIKLFVEKFIFGVRKYRSRPSLKSFL